MPLKTGLEVIEAIETKINRMNLKYKNCFIAKPDFIVISAFIMPTVITHLAKIGVTQVHQKPLEFDITLCLPTPPTILLPAPPQPKCAATRLNSALN